MEDVSEKNEIENEAHTRVNVGSTLNEKPINETEQ